MQHTFLYISLPFFCTTTTWNFQKLFSYTFYRGNVFSLPLIFTLHCWPLAFLILSPPVQNFHVVLLTKKCLLCFLPLAVDLCGSFPRWASLTRRLLSPFLCLFLALYSKFVDMTIKLSKLNTLDNTDIETISAFRFRLYWLFSGLLFTRGRWLCDFLPKYPRVAFGLPSLLIELFYVGVPVVRTDGWAYAHVITKFSRMGGLLHFLIHGAPLRCAWESSAIIRLVIFCNVLDLAFHYFIVCFWTSPFLCPLEDD